MADTDKDAPGKDKAPAAAADIRTPDEWCRELFPARRVNPRSERTRPHAELWKHAAAEALHGWREHAHHEGKPMELSRADYEKALEAACEPKAPKDKPAAGKPGEPPVPPPRASYQPHAAALSKHAPKARKG